MESGNIRDEIEGLRLSHAGSVKQKTVDGYVQKLYRVADFLDLQRLPTALDEIEPDHIGQFLKSLRVEGRSEHTIHGYLTAIRHLYLCRNKRLMAHGRASGRNPALPVPPVQCPDLNPDFLTEPELNRLLLVAKDPGHRAELATFGCTGLRSGELVNLRVGDIYIREGYLVVRYAGYRSAGPNKPNCERRVHLWPSYRAFLADYLLHSRPNIVPADCLWLFARSDGRPMSVDANHDMVQRYLKDVGFEKRKLGPHLLRRTFAVTLALHGFGLAEIALYLGHSKSTSTTVLLKNYIPDEVQARIVSCPPRHDDDPFVGIPALRVR